MKLLDMIDINNITSDDVSKIIGAEIRLRRITQNKTLSYVSKDTCSISYLSKIETNEIKPNPVLLEEICKRVRLSKDNLKTISRGKKLYDDIIEAIYCSNKEIINDIVCEVQDLKNYRAKMIKYIFSVYENDIYKAKRYEKDLMKLIGSMNNYDLIIFAYGQALCLYKEKKYKESYDIVKSLLTKSLLFDKLDALLMKIRLSILYRMNSNHFLYYYNILKNLYISYQDYPKIEEIDREVAYYLLRNGNYNSNFLQKNKDKYIDVLILYNAIMHNKINDLDLNEINFSKMIYLYYNDISKFKEIYEKLDNQINEEEKIILDIYYSKWFNKDFREDLLEIHYPHALWTQDDVVISFVENFVCEVLKDSGKYKKLLMIINNKKQREEMRGFYC